MEDLKQRVYDELARLDIKYEVVNHPPAMTTEEADEFIEGLEGVRSKTMFMCDKKKRRFYLFIMDDVKRIDIKKIGELIGDKQIRFAPAECLKEVMNLEFGSVSPFGLIYDLDHAVKVYIDKEILTEKIITFHPNLNTATVFITMDDMFKFLDSVGNEYEVIGM